MHMHEAGTQHQDRISPFLRAFIRRAPPTTGRTLRWWCVRKRPDLSADSLMSAMDTYGQSTTFREHFRQRWGREIGGDAALLQARGAKNYPLALVTRSTHK